MPVLAQEIVLRGMGVHTGLSSEIRIVKRDGHGDLNGLRFFWPGWREPLGAWDLCLLRRRAQRATVLEGEQGQIFRTPEHLLAAALFFSEAPLDIHCSACEPPGLDGSAEPFYNALAQVVPEAADSPDFKEYDSQLRWQYEGPEGQLVASPSASFSVFYTWDKPPLNQFFETTDATTLREVLPARTFILYREWQNARGAANLMAGVNMDSGLLFTESSDEFDAARHNYPEFQGQIFPLLHPENLRLDREPVRHKILDLVGDLALKGLALPRLRLEIRNGGHALNHLLLEQLLHE
jgi:UDP-3-O-acyl-N-acetylglucosamine deacetylase